MCVCFSTPIRVDEVCRPGALFLIPEGSPGDRKSCSELARGSSSMPHNICVCSPTSSPLNGFSTSIRLDEVCGPGASFLIPKGSLGVRKSAPSQLGVSQTISRRVCGASPNSFPVEGIGHLRALFFEALQRPSAICCILHRSCARIHASLNL